MVKGVRVVNTRDVIGGLQPSIFALIGVCTLIFFSYPKQVQKWKESPPPLRKPTRLQILRSVVFVLLFDGVFSVIFSPSAGCAAINFGIICVLESIAISITILGVKKYSKPSSASNGKV